MIDVLLHELSNSLNGELKDNHFAKGLYALLLKNPNVPEFGQLQELVVSHPTKDVSSTPLQGLTGRNIKFKNISISNIRKFPAPNTYSIKFTCKDDSICSSVLLGSNSVGKTTIFNCLEKVALGAMYSVKDNAGFDELEYLRNLDHQGEDINITLSTEKESFHIDQTLKDNPILTPSHFCSNNDAYTIQRNGIKKEFIAKQLGLSKYELILRRLKEVKVFLDGNRSHYLDLKKDFDYEKALLIILRKIKENDNNINSFLPFKLWNSKKDKLEGDKTNLSDEEKKLMIDLWNISIIGKCTQQYSEDEKESLKVIFYPKSIAGVNDTKDIDSVYKSIENNINFLQYNLSKFLKIEKIVDGIKTDFDSLYEDRQKKQDARGIEIRTLELERPILNSDPKLITNFYATERYLESKYKEALNNLIKDSNKILTILLKDYFADDIDSVSVKFNEDNNALQFNIVAKSPSTNEVYGSKVQSPQKYLNTFRFKLFCLSLKIALAFYTQKIHHIIAPIVIDDVFDSSDFTNRQKIEDFILNIYRAHEKIFRKLMNKRKRKGEGVGYQPLQLIYFTQDDVIAESVFNAIKLNQSPRLGKLSRIFDVNSILKDNIGESTNHSIEDIICEICEL